MNLDYAMKIKMVRCFLWNICNKLKDHKLIDMRDHQVNFNTILCQDMLTNQRLKVKIKDWKKDLCQKQREKTLKLRLKYKMRTN